MRYIALFKGSGGRDAGCDHTIGCNEFTEIFEATCEEDAEAQCRQKWEDNGGGYDSRIADIYLFKIDSQIVVPVDAWNQEANSQREEKEAAEELKEAEEQVRRIKARIRL